jgi:DNA modification methylase
MNVYRLLVGDVRDKLSDLPDASVQCVVTSPPYWGLRDYGVEGQLGLERTPEEYVTNMVAVFSEVRRVLRDDGTLWLNLGDSYNAQQGQQNLAASAVSTRGGGHKAGSVSYTSTRRATPPGLKPKDLVGIPWRVAFALQADGWWLRSDIVWSKPNPMPESVTDRPTKAHEYLFLLTKSAAYFYDADAIREPVSETPGAAAWRRLFDPAKQAKEASLHAEGMKGGNDGARDPFATARNRRSVWTIATQPYSGAHFATFPEALVEPCILAGSRVGDVVLDPFFGSGTVGVVALKRGREAWGIELNPKYAQLARERIEGDAPLLNRAANGP